MTDDGSRSAVRSTGAKGVLPEDQFEILAAAPQKAAGRVASPLAPD